MLSQACLHPSLFCISKPYFLVTPSKVTGIYFYQDNGCYTVTWDKEDTGNCMVEYRLQFDYGAVITTYGTWHKYCSPKHISVQLWGVYRGRIGAKAEATATTPKKGPFFLLFLFRVRKEL